MEPTQDPSAISPGTPGAESPSRASSTVAHPEAVDDPIPGGMDLVALLESTKAIPWEADPVTWRFTYVGPQAERLLGFPRAKWSEQDFWTDHIHPDDREQAVEFCLKASRLRRDYEFEYRMIHADGRLVWVHDIVHVESVRGETKSLKGFMIDISDRKRTEEALELSERQLRIMADTLPVFLLYVDASERYRFTNAAYEAFVGLPRAEILGHTVEEVLGPRAYSLLRDHMDTALSGRPESFQMKAPLRNGSVRVIQASYVPHRGPTGEVLGFYAVVTDVTDRVRAEEDAQRLRDELWHVSRVATMGELSGSLAHELNQPLCGIVSNAQAALRLLEPERPGLDPVREALSDIADDGKRAGEVIRHMRDLLRKGDLQRERLSLNDTLRKVGKLLEGNSRRNSITMVLDLQPDLPPVHGDGVQLQQVVLNLFINAIEAMISSGDTSGELKAWTSQDGPDRVSLSVRDSGVGLGGQDLDRIFDSFYTTKSGGLGMGLSINRAIVEAHDGQLWATSNPERGATFHLSLPVLREAAS